MPLAFRVTQVKKINKPSVFKKITTKRVFSTVQLLMICDKKNHFVVDLFKSCITRAGSLCWSLQVSTLRGVTDFESNFGSCSRLPQFFSWDTFSGKMNPTGCLKKTGLCQIKHLQILLVIGEKYLWFFVTNPVDPVKSGVVGLILVWIMLRNH